ncbi:MAG: single-stranded DNA-binding protein [Micrococcales bacterium]|nr:single-stranded DNA-binding protein [Micrococcales bacterium]
MKSLNRVQLLGRLGGDPEVRSTQNGTNVANFNIATSEKYTKDGETQEKTQWHRVVAWGKLAEIGGEYLNKGSLVMIEGKLETRQYEDKEGATKYATEIIASDIYLLPSGGKGEVEETKSFSKTSSKTAPTSKGGFKKNVKF